MIRVCIVDDQRLMREGLRTLMNLETDIHVEATASNGQEAVSILGQTPVDVVLMDIRMPVQDGINTTRVIKERWPHIRVLMLTTYEDRDDVVGALSAGAVGYLLKDMPGEEIAVAIRTANEGGAVLPPGIASTFLTAVREQGTDAARTTTERGTGFAAGGRQGEDRIGDGEQHLDVNLTEREFDVLNCLAEGLSNKEIAARLYVTEGTVKNHVSNLIAKLELRDRTQVALYAVRNGYGRYSDA